TYAPGLEGTPFEGHVDGVFIADHAGRVLACNQRLLELTQFDRADLVGGPCTSFIDSRLHEEFGRYCEAALRGSAQRVAVRGYAATGSVLFLEVTLVLDASGEKLIGVARDATRSYDVLDVPNPVTIIQSASRLARFSGWSIDVATGETTWGAEMFAILGIEGSDAPSYELTLDAFYDEPHRSLVEAAVRASVTDATPFDLQCELHDVHGATLEARILGQAVVDARGNVTRVEGAFYDVTELMRRNRATSDAERNLLATFDQVSMPLYVVGRDWRIVYVNQAGVELARLTPEAIERDTIWELFPESTTNTLAPVYHAAMDQGTFGAAVEHVDALDGDFEVVVHPVPQGIMITARSVSQEREAKRRLSEYEEVASSLAKMLDLTKDAVVVSSLRDGVTFWNHGAEALYGWTFDDVRGTSPEDYLYDDVESALAAIEVATRDGFWSGELRQRSRDGGRIVAESRLSLLRGLNGEPASLLSVHTDVTEARRALEARVRAQRMESLGTLAGGIAHDLNNVLTPMTLTLEMLTSRHREERDRQLLDALSTSVSRASDMVRQVLTFARGAESVRSHVAVRHLLAELRQFCANTLPKNIDVVFDEGVIDGAIWGDETQLLQVLVNLVTNARDAMRDGGRLTIRARPSTTSARHSSRHADALWAVFEVSDTGVGMDDETQSLIFEPFFTTKEFGEGTGLGLSTSLAIV
ncbi:MAG: PAS domain-containing protein, partial [Acidobacteriota bacterium]|nr:PAS domain-containing protein [Acidobacteriota bacterium]